MSTLARVGNNESLSFTTKVQIQANGLGFPTTALCDTGADARLLVSPAVAARAQKSLQARVVNLKKPIRLRDFRRQLAGTVTMKMIASLEIDGRRFPNETFWVTETGHDIFIGQYWLAEKNVLMWPRERQLIWPDDIPALAKFAPAVELPPSCGLDGHIDPKVQEDADRRDRICYHQHKQYQILRKPWKKLERQAKIDKKGVFPEEVESVPDDTESNDATVVAAITSQLDTDDRQERWAQREMPQEPIPFETEESSGPSVSLSTLQIWKTNQGKPIPFPEGEDPEHVKLVREKLPKQLSHLEGFFSKKAADTLPPFRPGHDVVLNMNKPTKGEPPRYRTPIQHLPLEKQTIDKLLKMGFIEPCMQEDAAPVLFVPKPHSTDRRFCIDYRWRNQFLKDMKVLAPDLNGTLFNCRDAERFTVIDVIQAFHRMRLSVGSEYLTAFRTRQGTFQWKVLPFGLKVGPAWWQRFINAQLNELLDLFASAYADDVLIYSGPEKEHWEQVKEVIHRLHCANLQGDIKKSRFNVQKAVYLGVMMEAGVGISIDPAKVEAIRNWKWEHMTSKTSIRSFLGLCNFVHMFCYHASEVAEPLNRLLKKDVPFVLGFEQQHAFETLKKRACEAPVMAFFKPNRPTKVETDASRNATGGVIWQQQEDDTWKPVGYFSKTMTPAERAYPIQDRELLAVVQTLEHYYPELLGMQFFVVTDHQALVYFANKRMLSTRQVRWAEFLSNFDITFQYRPGKDNVAADALSRKTADLPTVKAREQEERTMAMIPPEKLDFPVCAVAEEPPETPKGADLVDLIREENSCQALGFKDGRLWVPETTTDGNFFLRTALIREAHVPPIFAHPGQNKTIKILEREYYWPDMKKTIRQYVQNCHDCRRNKPSHDKTPGLLHSLPIPEVVWDHVVVDGKDMPKDRHGYDYAWAFIDKFSRILATLPGKKTDTAEDVAARYYRYLYRIFGMPAVWISDNAGPFVSRFLAKLNELTGTKHRHGSSYHPQTQGAIEFTNQELDQRLRFYVNKYQDNWSTHLPALDFAHNSSWHSAIDMAPLKVALGKDIRNPLSLDLTTAMTTSKPEERALKILMQTKTVQDSARAAAQTAQERQQTQANKKRRSVDFGIGDMVFLRKKGFSTTAPTTRLDSQWVGPFKIQEERGYSYVLDLPVSYTMKNLFHADRLRKAASNPLPQQHQPSPPPEDINGEPEFEVDHIERSRLFGKEKTLQYQVSWRGYDPDDTWYPARNFKNASIALEDFHRLHPKAPGPPKRLQEWIRAAANDKEDANHKDDNIAEHGELGTKARTKRHI